MKIFHICIIASLCIAQVTNSMQTATRVATGAALIGGTLGTVALSYPFFKHGLTKERELINLSFGRSSSNTIYPELKKATQGLGALAIYSTLTGASKFLFNLCFPILKSQYTSTSLHRAATAGGTSILKFFGLSTGVSATLGLAEIAKKAIETRTMPRPRPLIYSGLLGAISAASLYGWYRLE